MEHICPICGSQLQIANSKLVTEIGSADIYSELKMVCVNSAIDPKTKNRACSNYCGPDLDHPIKVVETVRNKVN